MRLRHLLISLIALGLLSLPLRSQQMENVPPAQQRPTPATATATGFKVGVLDLQAAMGRTQEGQKATQALQAQFGPRNAELQKLAQEIQELENKLRTQERTLSDEARLQLSRQLEKKRRTAQRLQEDLQTDFQIAQNDHISKIWAKMQKVIDQYAREKGFGIVLNSSPNPNSIIYTAPAIEITDDVIRLYDQLYPVETPPAASATQTKPARATPPRQPPR